MTLALIPPGTGSVAGKAVGEVAKALAVAAAGEALRHAVSRTVRYERTEADSGGPASQPNLNEVIQRMNFAPVINVTPTQIQEANDAIKMISDGDQVQDLKNKLIGDAQAANADFGGDLEQATEVGLAAGAIVARETDPRQALQEDDRAPVTKARRKSTDRVYASVEYHEWQYHQKKEAAKMYTLFGLTYIGTGSESNSDAPSYGEYVDGVKYRRMIEEYRRVQLAARGKGTTRLLELLGSDLAALLAAIQMNNTNLTTIINEAVAENPDWLEL